MVNLKNYEEMIMGLFFCADLHFGHFNCIEHCSRPFKDVEEMDETMIKNWNSKVGKRDTVYVVGDFTFRSSKHVQEYVDRLNGKILLVLGNHDERNEQITKVFRQCPKLLRIKHYKQRIILCHYALKNWQGKFRTIMPSWNLHGHGHCYHPENIYDLSIDVGVDGNGFYPYSFEEIQIIMARKRECWKRIINYDKNVSKRNGWL